jgi:cytochrome c oxidase subunit III
MNRDDTLLTDAQQDELAHSILVHHRLEEQYENPQQQHETAAFGMWVFLATEVMFFGVLFLGVGVYRYFYEPAVTVASQRLNWIIGGTNTIVLLISSLTMVLAVHYSRHGRRPAVMTCLALTALLGLSFLGLKAVEYYLDYVDQLIPGWRFDNAAWMAAGLRPDQVPHVKLFLMFYWIMTGFHALHVLIGITAVLVMFVLAWRRHFSADYYTPVDVTGLYWHFIDIVWIFLLPTLYLAR